jgi:hypothetical protein
MRHCSFMESWTAKLIFVLSAVPLAGCSRAKEEPRGFPCEDPGPVLIADKDTGFAFCTGGPVHRPKSQACPSKLPRSFECKIAPDDHSSCVTDADCSDSPDGFCQHNPPGSFPPGCGCAYGCTTDAQCGEGAICLCGDPVGRCAQASCTTDADCGGLLCASYTSNPGCDITAFACQNELDECMTDKDCMEGTQCTVLQSALEGAALRICSPPLCVF